jgi:hypothetical protein
MYFRNTDRACPNWSKLKRLATEDKTMKLVNAES